MTMIDRRGFLFGALTVIAAGAGEFRLGFAQAAAKGGAKGADVTPFITITPDNRIVIHSPNAEMGQGAATGHAQILAEELDADWNLVSVDLAPLGEAYKNPAFKRQATGGSTSIRAWYPELRRMGAAAREMLKSAAAAEWSVPAGEIATENSTLVHKGSGRKATYGEMAGAAAKQKLPDDPPLKDEKDFRIIGEPLRRPDTPAKVDGSLVYGIDLKLDGMLVAAVHMPPVFGARVKDYDVNGADKIPGVRGIHRIASGVAVVADGYWPARKALEQMTFTYDGPAEKLSSADIDARLRELLDAGEGVSATVRGDARKRIEGAKGGKVISRDYDAPFLAHATMQPITGAARFTKDGLEIWTSSQSPGTAAARAAEITGLSPDRITVHQMFLGGGFGRGAVPSADIQAVELAAITKRPVKVIWSREDDIAHDYYRPTAKARLRALLAADGKPEAVHVLVAAPSLAQGVGLPERDGYDPFSVEGLSDFPYAVPALEVTYARAETPVPLGFWRSVGHSFTAFFKESFIDELAVAAGQDPVAYRLALLDGAPRQKEVVRLAAEKAGWDKPLPKGRFRGIAQHTCYGGYVAEVVEISVVDGAPKLERVVAAVDCGLAINPRSIEAQIESAIVYGLSAARHGRITIADGAVEQSNFHDYPVITIADMPKVEVHLVASSEAPGGVGEIGTPPIAPALANAWHAATGARLAALPLDFSGKA